MDTTLTQGNVVRRTNRAAVRTFALVLLIALVPVSVLLALQFFSAPVTPVAAGNRLAKELDRLLEIRLEETLTLASLPSLRAFAASDPESRAGRTSVALNEMQAWVSTDPPVREVFVVDRLGNAILSTAKDWNVSWGARAFIKSALSGQPDISPPSRDLNEFSQYYSAPILDNRGEVSGALVVRLAAQEIWGPISDATDSNNSGTFALLVDENGVRLADGGDAARNLTGLSPLTVEQQTRIVNEQTYGSQVTLLRAGRFYRAADLIRSSNVDSIQPVDLGANAMAAQRLTIKPWTIFLVVPDAPLRQSLLYIVLSFIAAFGAAGIGVVLLSK